MRRSSAVTGLAVLLVSAGGVPATAASPVTVEPLVATPDSAFHIEVAASFPIRQLRDRYVFTLSGPGGRECETTVSSRVGITPPRRAKRVFVDMPGVRVVNRREIVPGPWCVGTFAGRVEFRDWRPRTRKFVVRRIGTFSAEVSESP